jgi:hypothetical protein
MTMWDYLPTAELSQQANRVASLRAERDALRARVQALETALIIIRDIPWRSHVRDPEGPARIAREVLKAGG